MTPRRLHIVPLALGLCLLLGSTPVQAQLVVEPSSLATTVPQGETMTRTVTLTNEGSQTLTFCVSFDRPLQRAMGTARLSEGALGSACGTYGEVLFLVDREGLPGCCADTYGLTMTPDGRLFTAGANDGRTIELDVSLNFVRVFDHPVVAEFEPFPATTGVTYNPDTETLWWLNKEAQGFTFYRALLLEGNLDGVPTGRRIELPVADTAPPPRASGSPVGLSYDTVTKRYYYVDLANSDVWAVDTLGALVEGYPVTFEAYTGVAFGFGLDAHSTNEDAAGLRFEVATNIPGQGGLRRIVVAEGFGGDSAPGAEPLVTPLPVPNPNAETGVMSGEPLRSRVDPNGVLYYPWAAFEDSGVLAIRPHPLPPSWLVVEAWNGTLAPGESRTIELTFRPGQRSVGEYTAVLQAFTATTGEAVEVPLALTVTQGTDAEAETASPEASSLSVYPNPTSASATVALSLATASEVRVVVYDVLGRAVATLADGAHGTGTHELTLEGRGLPAGVYVVRVVSDGLVLTRRLTLLR